LFAITSLRLSAALIITSALAALLALVAFAPTAQAHHSWGKYHWARATTDGSFNLKLGDNVSSDWDTYLNAAASSSVFADWSDSSVLDTTVVSGGTTGATCNPTSGRVEVCNAAYGQNGWLGIAQIWISGKHITQGTTKMNDTYFGTQKYNTPAWRQMVMCQEVGHTFGLDHQDENFNNTNLGTCMDYTNDPSGTLGTNGTLSNEHPNKGDYDELSCVYDPAYNRVMLATTTHRCTGTGHLDSTTTVGSASAASQLPAAASRGSFNSRAEWGRLVEESPNGKLELWVRDFGGGAKVVTWVIRP
jgi:hypothetical protein